MRAKLSPVELACYSGDELRARLARRAWYLVGDTLVDGWSAADFASYGVEQSIRYGARSPEVASTWMRQEILRRTRRAGRVLRDEFEDIEALEASEPVATRLPEYTLRWLAEHVSPAVVEALTGLAEESLTNMEVVTKYGVTTQEVVIAIRALRSSLVPG